MRGAEQQPEPDSVLPFSEAPAHSQSGSNLRSTKSWSLVIDYVHGAVPFMSQRTIYAVKGSHMVSPPQRSGVLIIQDELEVQC